MYLTARIRMLPNLEQADALLAFMERFNMACNKVSLIAFQSNNFNRVGLQKQCYYGVKDEFGLGAQSTILVTRKVADSYRTDLARVRSHGKSNVRGGQTHELKVHKFKKHGCVTYDSRNLSFKPDKKVSILTLAGRIEVPITQEGPYSNIDLSKAHKEIGLLYRKHKFYLAISLEAVENAQYSSADFIGVDLGRKNIATTSDGRFYCGEGCESTRQRYKRLTRLYQSIGTKSAMRHLSKLSGKEAAFKRNENHRISKELVSEAKGTGRGLALEDLTYIPRPVSVNKDRNDASNKWAFGQLRYFVEYKAKLAGVPIRFIDPAYTSQRCNICGYINEGNRASQSSFVCLRCGHEEHADLNAARNIRDVARAAINQPIVVHHAIEV